jgi:DNA topoisomerase-1
MGSNLVIVESPAKAKTIKKYLGKDFEVLASYGHVRDLVPKEGAVDPTRNFAMQYQLIERNEKHVHAIARALKKAKALYLATDPDREGEAIAWHLHEILKERGELDGKDVHRVAFYEITRNGIRQAIEEPRSLSGDLVNAQQARRALDYLVGFNLSPLLWKKVRRGLSAGRVQSPALRMICEREEEIEAFKAREYWTIDGQAEHGAQPFPVKLIEFQGRKVEQFSFQNAAEAHAVERALRDASGLHGAGESAAPGALSVLHIDKKQRRRNPAPPFTTSTLQQEAARKLGFGAQKTMRTAQQLYEGIDAGDGAVGLITYMRTDSVNLAAEAVTDIRATIEHLYGKEGLAEEPRVYKTKSKNAQEAHEAIRPTTPSLTPADLEGKMDADQHRLYSLIWKRAIACQMSYALYDTVAVDLLAGGDGATRHLMRANGSTLVKPGFMAVYHEDVDDANPADESDRVLPPMSVGDRVKLLAISPEQHFTEPPPRYSEASLVKALEEHGIGRPSTYASIISTLRDREYVEVENRRFTPTDIGKIVNRFLTRHFHRYVEYGFTARMEDTLDAISRGEEDWLPLMHQFWQPFITQVKHTEKNVSREEVAQARNLGVDAASGRPVSVRMGRYGPFVQMGTKDDEEKPRFAGLKPGQKMDAITLADAMELFKLPRTLGTTAEGETVLVNIGRFGPYIKYGSKYVSLKEDDPYTVELDRALVLIEQKKIADANRIILDFADAGIQVLNGRYGPYITDKTRNAKIPKDRDPKTLTLDECRELLAQAPVRGRRGRGAPAQAAAQPGATAGAAAGNGAHATVKATLRGGKKAARTTETSAAPATRAAAGPKKQAPATRKASAKRPAARRAAKAESAPRKQVPVKTPAKSASRRSRAR